MLLHLLGLCCYVTIVPWRLIGDICYKFFKEIFNFFTGRLLVLYRLQRSLYSIWTNWMQFPPTPTSVAARMTVKMMKHGQDSPKFRWRWRWSGRPGSPWRWGRPVAARSWRHGLLPVPPLLVGCAGDDSLPQRKRILFWLWFFLIFLHQCHTIQNLWNTFFCIFVICSPDVYILIQSDYIFLILLTQTFVTCTMQKVLWYLLNLAALLQCRVYNSHQRREGTIVQCQYLAN